MKPLVSVIIPTYGSPDFLERGIQSVIGQTYKYWELIVVDDNNDGTKERIETASIMKKFADDSRIIYIQHECNKNGAAARNTGITSAKGEYISFLDSDDEYLPTRLERCVEAITKAESDSWAGVYTGCEIKKNGVLVRRRTEIKSGNFIVETLAAAFPLSSGSNLFIRANVVRELEGFDVVFRRHQDYEFLVRFFRKYSLIAVPEVLLIKNEIGSNQQNVEKFYATKKQYLSKFREDVNNLTRSQCAYVYAEHYLVLQATAFRQRTIKDFLKFTCKSLVNRPAYTVLRTCKLFARTILKKSGRVNS